jgi:glycosyltransferase involved in cell wall biosynthesis
MNVLHINQSYEIKGGAEVYVHQLQELLPEYGISSFFVAVSESSNKKFDITGKEISLVGKTKREVHQFLLSYLEEYKIDLIHIHSISNEDLVRFCLDHKPVVRSMHEPRTFCPGRQKFFLKSETVCQIPFGLHCNVHAYTQKCQDSRRPAEVLKSYSNVSFEINHAAKKYKQVIAMSNYIKSEAVLAGFPDESITINPYFTPVSPAGEEIANGINDEKRIVFVGRLHPSKGIHTLIRSLSNVLKDQNNVFLDIIGDGLFKSQLLNLISSENIPTEKIIFHGWLQHQETIQKIKHSYLVVFPSIYPEAFGIVGIEAMMLAKPVVAFNVGGVSEWLQDGVTGFLVPVKNEKVFEEKTLILLNDKKTYQNFAVNAKNNALLKFTPAIHMGRLVELYKNSLIN